MEGSLCTQILPPAPNPAPSPIRSRLRLSLPPQEAPEQGRDVLGEESEFSASRDRLCSRVWSEEGWGRRSQHHRRRAGSGSHAKNTHAPVSHQHDRASRRYRTLLEALRSDAVPRPHPAPAALPSTALPSHPRMKNNPQGFKRLLDFISCHCTSTR